MMGNAVFDCMCVAWQLYDSCRSGWDKGTVEPQRQHREPQVSVSRRVLSNARRSEPPMVALGDSEIGFQTRSTGIGGIERGELELGVCIKLLTSGSLDEDPLDGVCVELSLAFLEGDWDGEGLGRRVGGRLGGSEADIDV